MIRSDFFSDHSEFFAIRAWDRIADEYAVPFALYSGGAFRIFGNRDQLLRGLSDYGAALALRGIVASTLTLDALSMPRRDTQTAWVSCVFRDKAGEPVILARKRYYFRRDGLGHVRLDMIESASNVLASRVAA